MNPLDTIQIFCSPGEGLTKAMVSAIWSEKYNMKYHSVLHVLIEELWIKKSESAIKLFNRSKFRLQGVEENRLANSSIADIKFLLGITSYKEFIGTNCAPFAAQLAEDGIKNYSDSQSYLANPVGVGGILETSDGNLVFMRRSSMCAEMPGLIDRPGGHPEPDEVTSNFDLDLEHIESAKVVDELFDSVLKEIRDEINIPIEHLSQPVLLGISYNPQTWRRPSLEFYVRCDLPAKEALALYSEQTQAESEESTALIIVPVLQVLDVNNFKKWEFYPELTHAAQSAIHLLQIFLSK